MDHGAPAADHRPSAWVNGRGAGQPVATGIDPEDGTWFEELPGPPVDTPLIALIPVPRGELAG